MIACVISELKLPFDATYIYWLDGTGRWGELDVYANASHKFATYAICLIRRLQGNAEGALVIFPHSTVVNLFIPYLSQTGAVRLYLFLALGKLFSHKGARVYLLYFVFSMCGHFERESRYEMARFYLRNRGTLLSGSGNGGSWLILLTKIWARFAVLSWNRSSFLLFSRWYR